MKRSLSVSCLVSLVLSFAPAISRGAMIDFETLPDLVAVDSFYSGSGVVFQNAISLTAGISLNEFDFPPHSGAVVVGDEFPGGGMPMSILFSTPVDNVSGYVAYVSELRFTAYGSGGSLLGSLATPTSTHLGSTQQVAIPYSGVARIDITTALANSFILDDLSFQPGTVTVPDQAATLPLLGCVCLLLLAARARNAHDA